MGLAKFASSISHVHINSNSVRIDIVSCIDFKNNWLGDIRLNHLVGEIRLERRTCLRNRKGMAMVMAVTMVMAMHVVPCA